MFNRIFELDENDFKELIGLTKSKVTEFIIALESKHKKRGRPTKLPCQEEVLLFLLHFRHYPVDVFMGAIFGINKQTANNITSRMTKKFYKILQPSISLKTYNWRIDNSCTFFHTQYTFIVDGSEQGVAKSKLPVQDGSFYSTKKCKHTINILLVVSVESRKLLYLSPSYPGSINDPKIVENTKTKWLDLLEPNEYGIGDSIFKFDESIHIHPPPSDERSTLYSDWCRKRVPVENYIENIKNFRACKDPLRMPISGRDEEILKVHNMNWHIGAGFVNETYRQ